MGRRTPYECGSCGAKAVINPQIGMRVVAAYVAALAILVFGLEHAGAGAVEAYAVCLIAALAIPAVFAWLCRFERPAAGQGVAEPPQAIAVHQGDPSIVMEIPNSNDQRES